MRARGGLIQRSKSPGYSLVELVNVVVIIGIVSAIAVPRISAVTKGPKRSALKAFVVNAREAI